MKSKRVNRIHRSPTVKTMREVMKPRRATRNEQKPERVLMVDPLALRIAERLMGMSSVIDERLARRPRVYRPADKISHTASVLYLIQENFSGLGRRKLRNGCSYDTFRSVE